MTWKFSFSEIPPIAIQRQLDAAVRAHLVELSQAGSVTRPWSALVDELEKKLNVILKELFDQETKLRIALAFQMPAEKVACERLEALLELEELKDAAITGKRDLAVALDKLLQAFFVSDEMRSFSVTGDSAFELAPDECDRPPSAPVLQSSKPPIEQLNAMLKNLCLQVQTANRLFRQEAAAVAQTPTRTFSIETFEKLVQTVEEITELWVEEIEGRVFSAHPLNPGLKLGRSAILGALSEALKACQRFDSHLFCPMQEASKNLDHLQVTALQKLAEIFEKQSVTTFYRRKKAWEQKIEGLSAIKEQLMQCKPWHWSNCCMNLSEFFENFIAVRFNTPAASSYDHPANARNHHGRLLDDLSHQQSQVFQRMDEALLSIATDLTAARTRVSGYQNGVYTFTWVNQPRIILAPMIDELPQALLKQQMSIETALKSSVEPSADDQMSLWPNHCSPATRDSIIDCLFRLSKQCDLLDHALKLSSAHFWYEKPQCAQACKGQIAATKNRALSLIEFIVHTSMYTFDQQADARLCVLMQSAALGVRNPSRQKLPKPFNAKFCKGLEQLLEARLTAVKAIGRQCRRILLETKRRSSLVLSSRFSPQETFENAQQILSLHANLREMIDWQMELLRFEPFRQANTCPDWSPNACRLFQDVWVEMSKVYAVMTSLLESDPQGGACTSSSNLCRQLAVAILTERANAPTVAEARRRNARFLRQESTGQPLWEQQDPCTFQTLDRAIEELNFITQRQEQWVMGNDQLALTNNLMERAADSFSRLQSSFELITLAATDYDAGERL